MKRVNDGNYCDLSNLERINKNMINWDMNIGNLIPFKYNEIEGVFKIIGTRRKYHKNSESKIIELEFEGKQYLASTNALLGCSLGKVLGVIGGDFVYEVGDNIKDDRRDLVILEKYVMEVDGKCTKTLYTKRYKYKCNKCGNVSETSEGTLIGSKVKQPCGCNVCNASIPKISLGINTIWDTDRWMIDLGVSEEDAKRYGKGSTKDIEVICPNCGNKKIMKPNTIYGRKSIQCVCSDGRSYPEKFMINVLNQLKVDFEIQYSPEWAKPKRYDFYIPTMNMIIETHGSQHYKEANGFKNSLEEIQKNDELKRESALSNGIERYIVIDCRKSEFDWMTFNVYKSLKDYFDMIQVDFGQAEMFALNNMVKLICDYWNERGELDTVRTIAENNPWGMKSRTAIIKYLKIGTARGWCYYNPDEEKRKQKILLRRTVCRKVEIFKDEISLGVFNSPTELEKQSGEKFGIKLSGSAISSVCTGRRKTHKGFTFKYLDNK